jgi:hypothetical protein
MDLIAPKTCSNRTLGEFTKELISDFDIYGTKRPKVVLVEINHFFANHCALPAILKSISTSESAPIVARPFLPLEKWSSEHSTLKFVGKFYESIGIVGPILKATPTHVEIHEAKSIVLENIRLFSGDLVNLSDLSIDGLPIGVHLVETILQTSQAASLEQNDATLLYAIKLIAIYLWWKSYIKSHNIVFVLSSHLCYEFAIPQLAAISCGVSSLAWSWRFLWKSNLLLPLPLIAWHKTTESVLSDWHKLPESDKVSFLKLAEQELFSRAEGKVVGVLEDDPRVVSRNLRQHDDLVSQLSKSARLKVVFFVHAFSDAPCVFPTSSYQELTNPLLQTEQIFENIANSEIDLYIKTHPLTFSQDEQALQALLAKYPNVKRLPSDMTLSDIKASGFRLVITGYGSVTPEAAFLSLSVINYASFSHYRLFSNICKVSKISELKKDIFECLERDYNSRAREEAKLAHLMCSVGDFLDLTSSQQLLLNHDDRFLPAAYDHWYSNFDVKNFSELTSYICEFINDRNAVVASEFGFRNHVRLVN